MSCNSCSNNSINSNYNTGYNTRSTTSNQPYPGASTRTECGRYGTVSCGKQNGCGCEEPKTYVKANVCCYPPPVTCGCPYNGNSVSQSTPLGILRTRRFD